MEEEVHAYPEEGRRAGRRKRWWSSGSRDDDDSRPSTFLLPGRTPTITTPITPEDYDPATGFSKSMNGVLEERYLREAATWHYATEHFRDYFRSCVRDEPIYRPGGAP